MATTGPGPETSAGPCGYPLCLSFALGLLSCGGRAETSEAVGGEDSAGTGGLGVLPSDPDGSEPEDCIPGVLGASRVLGLHLTEKLDGLAFVELGPDHVPTVVLEQVGSVCPDSGSESWCLLEDNEPITGFYFSELPVPYALIANGNDTLTPLGYWEVRDLLGEIDTKNEAAVLAWTEGWNVSCKDLRAGEAGYEFTGSTDCENEAFVVQISREAEISANAFCAEF
jgi:hypothetical protein